MEFQQMWSQALTAVHNAEDEAQKLFARLQGVGQDEARKLSERLEGQRKALEHRLDEVVTASVSRLKVPTRAQLTQLNTRLDALTRRAETLSR